MVCVVAVWTELPSPSRTYPWSALLLFGQSYRLQAIYTRGIRWCCLDRATVSKPYIPVVCVVAVWTELPSPSHTYPWSALLLFGQSYRLQAIHTRGLRCCCLDRATVSMPYIPVVCVVAVWTELPSPSCTYPWSALILFGQSYRLQAIHTRGLRCCCLDRATVSKPYIPVVCVVAVWTELPSPSHTYPWSALLLFGQSYRLQAIHTRGLRCCCLDRATVSKLYIPVVCVDTVWTELPSPSPHIRGLRCCRLDRATVSKPYILAGTTQQSRTFPFSLLEIFLSIINHYPRYINIQESAGEKVKVIWIPPLRFSMHSLLYSASHPPPPSCQHLHIFIYKSLSIDYKCTAPSESDPNSPNMCLWGEMLRSILPDIYTYLLTYLLTYARLLAGCMSHRSKLSTGSCAAPWCQFPARCTPSSSLPTRCLSARCFLAVRFSSSLVNSKSVLVL